MRPVSIKNWRDDLKIETSIDVVDKYNESCSANVIDINLNNKEIKISYYGWSSDYDEWIPNYSRRISPSNSITIPFIGLQPPLKIENNTQIPKYYKDITSNISYFIIPTTTHLIKQNINNGQYIQNIKYPKVLSSKYVKYNHILDNIEQKMYFIKIWGKRVITFDFKTSKWNSSNNASLEQINNEYHINILQKLNQKTQKLAHNNSKNKSLSFYDEGQSMNSVLFMIENEIHILRMIKKFANKVEHIKYDKIKNQFVYLGDIELNDYIVWKQCKFIYNHSQKRLYLLSLPHLADSKIFYINNRKKYNVERGENRKWRKCRLRGYDMKQFLNKITKTSSMECILIFRDVLLIENRFNMICIDLQRMRVFSVDKAMPAVDIKYRYLMNGYDNYLNVINYNGQERYWYKICLLDILPNELFKYYRDNKYDILITGYVRRTETDKMLCFPDCLTQYILSYYPIFLYH